MEAAELLKAAREKLEAVTKQTDEVLKIGTTYLKKSQVQAVQAMEEADNCTYIFLVGGARLMVKENIKQVLSLLKWQ